MRSSLPLATSSTVGRFWTGSGGTGVVEVDADFFFRLSDIGAIMNRIEIGPYYRHHMDTNRLTNKKKNKRVKEGDGRSGGCVNTGL